MEPSSQTDKLPSSQIEPNANDSQSKENAVELDTIQIDLSIQSHGIYEEQGKYLIKPFTSIDISTSDRNIISINEETQLNKYIAKIQSSFEYTGILSNTLSKETFGLNKYPEGDYYLGQWKNDSKEGVGMYYYNPSPNTTEGQQVYIGQWENCIKQGKGILYCFNSTKQEELFQCSFDAYIGSFTNDNFTEGIGFKQTVDNANESDNTSRKKEHILYKGKYNDKREREDEKGIILQNGSFVFDCTMTNDDIQKGWIMTFKEDSVDQLKDAFCFDKQKENKIKYLSFEGIEKQLSDFIEYKKKYDLIAVATTLEKYYNSVMSLKPNFEDIDNYNLSSIESAIKLFEGNQLSYDTIVRPEPLPTE